MGAVWKTAIQAAGDWLNRLVAPFVYPRKCGFLATLTVEEVDV